MSSKAVEVGNQWIKSASLKNITLEEKDLNQFKSNKKFDYIICHGVFSWTSKLVQDSILRICSENLSENGVAYVSYNSSPGWDTREALKNELLKADNEKLVPSERVKIARAKLQEFAKSKLPTVEATKLGFEATSCLKQSDAFILHELLNRESCSIQLNEFLERIKGFELAYISEANPVRNNDSENTGLPFRAALVTHVNNKVHSQFNYESISDLHVTTPLTHQEKLPDIESDIDIEFFLPGGDSIKFNSTIEKSILCYLSSSWPKSISSSELLEAYLYNRSECSSNNFLKAISSLYFKGYLNLYASKLLAADKISNTPAVLKTSKFEVQNFDWVTNCRHEYISYNLLEKIFLENLDGSKSSGELSGILQDKLKSGELDIKLAGEDIQQDNLPELIDQQIQVLLKHLLEKALLVTNQSS